MLTCNHSCPGCNSVLHGRISIDPRGNWRISTERRANKNTPQSQSSRAHLQLARLIIYFHSCSRYNSVKHGQILKYKCSLTQMFAYKDRVSRVRTTRYLNGQGRTCSLNVNMQLILSRL